MGKVWAARHEMLGRDFALKFATLPVRAGPEARARFMREAQTVGRLRHPNVVDVADFGEVEPGGGLYLAMELLEGSSLAERIAQHGVLRPREAAAIAVEIARGLSAAHAAGIVHRDIKPENIFLAKSPGGGVMPKLLDFGISKQKEDETLATLGGLSLGTPAYMSPEQALGELDVDHRSDIWSLGVVLYEMLSGRHPFVAPNYQALLPKIADDSPAALDPAVPAKLRSIVARCLEKRREDRYPDADALGAALEEALDALGKPEPGGLVVERTRKLPSLRPPGQPSVAPPAAHSPPAAMAPASRRGPTGAIALALGVVVVAAAGVLGVFLLRAPRGTAPAGPTPSTVAVAPASPAPTPQPAPQPTAQPAPTATALATAHHSASASTTKPPRAQSGGGRKGTSTSVTGPGF
jgi:serine/threonine-protein kinase